ncbi:MAG: hypothetical protein QM500_19915 [Methylococcales bacterium]
MVKKNKASLLLKLRNEMCQIESEQDRCSELEHDELENRLCDIETAYIHIERDIKLSNKDNAVIKEILN